MKEGFARQLKGRLAKAAGWVTVLKFGSLALGLLTSSLLARFLGPESYGSYALVTSLMTMVALPLQAGLPNLLVREVATLAQRNEWGMLRDVRRKVFLWIAFGSVLLVSAVLLYFRGNVPVNYGSFAAVAIGAVLVPLLALNSTRSAILRGLKKPVLSQLPEMLVQPALHAVVLGVVAYRSGLTTTLALGSLVLSTALSCLVGQYFMHRRFSRAAGVPPVPVQTATWVKLLLPFTLLAAIQTANGQIGTLLMGAFATSSEVAYFRIASRLAQLVSLFLLIANMVAAPYVTQYFNAGDKARLQQICVSSIRVAFLLSLAVSAVFGLFGRPLVGLVFGDAYATPVHLPLIVLCVAQLINVFFGSVGMLLNMTGHEKYTVRGVAFGLLVNVVSGFVLIPTMGALGGAIAAAMSMACWNVYLAFCVRAKLGIRTTPL